MSVTFDVDVSKVEQLTEAIKQFQDEAETKINTYLHGEGYRRFEQAIHNAMPVSGRSWNGKRAAAKTSRSVQDKDKGENLAVTLHSTTVYGYLYFPDDGSNTKHHYGGQHFFEKGVENETTQAINDMIDILMKEV
jgi:hypothetical protein